MGVHFILALIFMGITGILDGQAFNRISLIWQAKDTARITIIIQILAFINAGMLTYIVASYYLFQQGIHNSLIMTLLWFIVTIMTLVILGGNFSVLSTGDKILTIVAIVCIGLLYLRGIAQ